MTLACQCVSKAPYWIMFYIRCYVFMCLNGFFQGHVLSEKGKQRSNLNLSQQGIIRIADIINSSHVPKGEGQTISVIDLDNNNITKLDLEILIDVFPNLQAIVLRNNQINDIKTTAITQINKLLKVDLCKNRLTLREKTFFQLSVLTHLYLCENGIHKIPEKVFKGLEQLKFLDLKNNKLLLFHVSWFSQLKNLETLDLSYNAIESWVPDDFLWQNKLNILNIKENQLKSLPPLPVRAGSSVNLLGNEIYCGCHLPTHKQTPKNSTILVDCSDQKEIWLGYHGTLLHFIQQHTPTCEKPSVEFVSRRINGEFLMTCTGSGVPVPHQIAINTTSGSIIKNLSTKIKPILTLSESQEKSAKCTVRSLIGVESAATRLKESFRPAADVGTTTTGAIIGLSIFTLLSITVNIAVASVAFWAVTVERPVIEERETLAL